MEFQIPKDLRTRYEHLLAVRAGEKTYRYFPCTYNFEAALIERIPGWVSVNEDMPADTKAVLVWRPERRNKYTAYWRDGCWSHFGGSNRALIEEVTHWMKTPEPPKESS